MTHCILFRERLLQVTMLAKDDIKAYQLQINQFLASVFDSTIHLDINEELHCAVLITLQDEIIGCGVAYTRDIFQAETLFSAGIVGAIAVSQHHRGKGLCKKILALLEREFILKGVSHSFLFAYHPSIYYSSDYRDLKAPIHYFDKMQQKWNNFVYRGGMVKTFSEQQIDEHQVIDFQGCIY